MKSTFPNEHVKSRRRKIVQPLPEDTVAVEEEDGVSDTWRSEDVESQDSEGSSDDGDEINEVVRKSARAKTN
jgi:hypothetical protein